MIAMAFRTRKNFGADVDNGNITPYAIPIS
jgi:hypothetical protein